MYIKINQYSFMLFVDQFILCLERLQYSYNWSMIGNPRITNFISTTKDENNALKIMTEFRAVQNPTLHWLICKYTQCNIIRSEPEFIQILFNDHLNLVIEMIEWMLMPKTIAKRKKIKSNLDFFPYRCKEFIKDNLSFYDSMYIFARNNKLPFSLWFNFLRKQYYDEQTVLTALGYFGEAIIPFAKYGFSSSTNLTQSVELNAYQSKNENLSIMKILPKQLIEEIVDWCYHQHIFQFIKIAILVCIQDPTDYQICNSTMLKIFQKSQVSSLFTKLSLITQKNEQDLYNKIQLLDHISQSIKQLIANIQPSSDIQVRIQQFVSIILESRIIPYTITQILQNKLLNPVLIQKKRQTTDLSSSQQLPSKSSQKNKLFNSLGKVPKNIKNVFQEEPIDFLQYTEEQVMEILLRILTSTVQIFIRIPKSIPFTQDTTNCTEQKQDRESDYKEIIYDFHEQMQMVLDSLQKMIRLVYVEPQSGQTIPFKIIPFSSGQKIKAISFMKFEFFKLIHNCLIMTQCCSQNFDIKFQKLTSSSESKPSKTLKKMTSLTIPRFQLNVQKLFILEIIQKYLNENRWNNLVHHTLQRICHSLVICNYDYLSKNFSKMLNKKTSESFLAFLIENFTQRHYIFLNTFKFTPQGNLQSLYNISKDLAYTLNSTNQLVIMLNEFEPWQKFIMNDLKVYEQKTYPVAIHPEDQYQDDSTYTNVSGLKVDEADSIKKLIQNIALAKRFYPTKTLKKGQSRSGIIRNSDEKKQTSEQLQNFTNSRQYHIKIKKQKAIQQFLKKKVEYRRKFQKDHQIQQLDVEDISVREQLDKDYKQKQRTSKTDSKANTSNRKKQENMKNYYSDQKSRKQ